MKSLATGSRGFQTYYVVVVLVSKDQKTIAVGRRRLQGAGKIRRVLYGLQLTHKSNVDMVVVRILDTEPS